MLVLVLVPIIAFFVTERFRNCVYFIGWHFHILKVPHLSEIISNQNDSLWTVNFRYPDERKLKPIINSIEYLYKLQKSVLEVEAKVESQLKKLEINRPQRMTAVQYKSNFEKMIEEYKRFSRSFINLELTVGIGIKEEGLKTIDSAMKDIGKYLFNNINATAAIKLSKPLDSISTTAIFTKDPSAIINKIMEGSYFDSDVLKKITSLKKQMSVDLDLRFGFPAFKVKFIHGNSKEMFFTLIAREYLIMASDAETFKKIMLDLQKGISTKQSQSHSPYEILWAKVNLEKIVQGLPEKLRIFLPASVRNVKSMVLDSNLSERIHLGSTIHFKDATSAQEALVQLNMLKGLIDTQNQKMGNFKEDAETWIKRYHSLSVQGSSIVAKIDFPISDSQIKLQDFLKTEYTRMSKDFANLSSVLSYMKANKLVKMSLKSINDFKPVSEVGFPVHEGTVFSLAKNVTSVRPLMLITEASCEEESKYDFEFVNKAKSKSISMYKMNQDPKIQRSLVSSDRKSKGIQVYVLSGAEFSNEWELIFHTPLENQLENFKVSNIKDDSGRAVEPKAIVKFRPQSHCQISSEPFILAQSL